MNVTTDRLVTIELNAADVSNLYDELYWLEREHYYVGDFGTFTPMDRDELERRFPYIGRIKRDMA